MNLFWDLSSSRTLDLTSQTISSGQVLCVYTTNKACCVLLLVWWVATAQCTAPRPPWSHDQGQTPWCHSAVYPLCVQGSVVYRQHQAIVYSLSGERGVLFSLCLNASVNVCSHTSFHCFHLNINSEPLFTRLQVEIIWTRLPKAYVAFLWYILHHYVMNAYTIYIIAVTLVAITKPFLFFLQVKRHRFVFFR